tara:strand:- start:9034 stop:9210 length:177 start_codon:yes stop_codon:yes gene_type:complete
MIDEMEIDCGDLVLINDKLLGLVFEKTYLGDQWFYHTQFFDEGLCEVRWVHEIFIERC